MNPYWCRLALTAVLGWISGGLAYAQLPAPTLHDYTKMPEKGYQTCSATDQTTVENIYYYIEANKSKKAVELTKNLNRTDSLCPEGYEAVAWALFRHGQWEKALPFVDKGIGQHGSHPNLVSIRGYMNFEMAETGPVRREVDGNTVLNMNYLMQEDLDEGAFRSSTYHAALNDLEYIITNHLDREYETYLVGVIHQRLGNFSESNRYLSRLEHNREYSDEVRFMKVINYIDIQDYRKAETLLEELEALDPMETKLHEQYVELYKRLGKVELVMEHQKKMDFSRWVPSFVDLPYSETNYQDLHFLITSTDEGQGMDVRTVKRAIRALSRTDQERATKLLVSVLYAARYPDHPAVAPAMEELEEIGASAVPMLIDLLRQECPSTLPATWSATILANNGDPRGWNAMVECLPNLDDIPFSVVPPPVPECMVRLDQTRALPILLKRLTEPSLSHRYHYLYPLKLVTESRIRKEAAAYMSASEVDALIKEIQEVDR